MTARSDSLSDRILSALAGPDLTPREALRVRQLVQVWDRSGLDQKGIIPAIAAVVACEAWSQA